MACSVAYIRSEVFSNVFLEITTAYRLLFCPHAWKTLRLKAGVVMLPVICHDVMPNRHCQEDRKDSGRAEFVSLEDSYGQGTH